MSPAYPQPIPEIDPPHPKQAILHRAVSASCYALYRFPVGETAHRMFAGPTARLFAAVRRAFAHGIVKTLRDGSRTIRFRRNCGQD